MNKYIVVLLVLCSLQNQIVFGQTDSISNQYSALLDEEKRLYVKHENNLAQISFRIQSLLSGYSDVVVYKSPSAVCAKREECSYCQSIKYSTFYIREISSSPKHYALWYRSQSKKNDEIVSVEIKEQEPYLWYSRIQYYYLNPQIGLIPDFQKMNEIEKTDPLRLEFTYVHTQTRFEWLVNVFDEYLKKSYNSNYVAIKK